MIQDKKKFQYLILNKASLNTISGSSNLIEGSGRVNIIYIVKIYHILLNQEEI